MAVTRRWVIAAGTAGAGFLSGPGWLRPAWGQAKHTRYSATSEAGKAMLVKYAKAVDIMRNKIPKGDPRHWNFQWYSHWIPGPQSWAGAEAAKKKMLADVYGTSTGPNRELAEAMWNDCQSHGSNPNDPKQYQTTFFLPWHRYFVYYFEEIIRGVLQDDSFTLPYWNYLGGSVADLSIPPEFYKDTSSPLFQANRNSWVNTGQRIDLENRGALNLGAFNYNYYIDAGGSTGFCPTTNGNPHGLVHNFTGNSMNMGNVPTAAGDPIFWLHHSNIDRFWASWNLLGNKNPQWESRLFPFADGSGKKVTVNLNGATGTAQLGYDYDSYQKPPGGASSVAAAPPTKLVTIARGAANAGVTLAGAKPTRVPLSGTGRSGPTLGAVPNGKTVFLTLADVDVKDGFDGTYNVYVGLPDGAQPDGAEGPNYVGTFGSFALRGHGGHGHDLAFDVTQAAASLAAQKQAPSVTFIPKGDIATTPTVGAVALATG